MRRRETNRISLNFPALIYCKKEKKKDEEEGSATEEGFISDLHRVLFVFGQRRRQRRRQSDTLRPGEFCPYPSRAGRNWGPCTARLAGVRLSLLLAVVLSFLFGGGGTADGRGSEKQRTLTACTAIASSRINNEPRDWTALVDCEVRRSKTREKIKIK